MRHRPLFHWILPAMLVAASTTALFGSAAGPASRPPTSGPQPTRARLAQAYGRLPLSFEANEGQSDPGVTFLARGLGYTVSLTRTGAAVALRRPAQTGAPEPSLAALGVDPSQTVMRLELLGANPDPVTAGLDRLPGTANYFIGSDPSKWHTGIPTYARVELQGVYPGIDLTYYGSERTLEYDFSVAPWANPKVIAIGFPGADQLQVGPEGNLMVRIASARIVQLRPVAYQQQSGSRRLIGARYVLGPHGRVSVRLAAYDRSKPLVIDPTLAYSTYLGGSDTEEGTGIAVDGSGSAYVTGFTGSPNFPTASPFQGTNAGGGGDAFVTKLNPAGSALVYSTYLGGTGSDGGTGIAVDASGSAYVTGSTFSSDFPTASPFQATNPGGGAFVTKLNPAGSALVYSTYLGGNSEDLGSGIAVDASGSAYVTGFTVSTGFPTVNPIQGTLNGPQDDFVTKLNPSGSALVYSTFLGGSDGEGQVVAIAVDRSGRAYVSGETLSTDFPTANAFQPAHGGGSYDVFVTKLNASGSAFVYSTYLGGTGNDGGAGGHGIAADASGNAYVTAFTSSPNFPTASPFQGSNAGVIDAFVTKLNANGSTLVYSTYLGGGNGDGGRGITVDAAGNAYVTGGTSSPDFPTANPIQGTLSDVAGGDAFVTKVNPAGSALVYSTFLGGHGRDDGVGIAVDASGNNAYVTGDTFSTDFPTANPFQGTSGGGSRDAIVAKISTPPTSCTIHGTNQDDLLVGSSAGDGICGRGGNDTIDGRGGDDDLRGGAGDDTIVGGAGADVIRGGAGNDDINARDGVSGNDTVYGGAGRDVCVIDAGDTTFGCETVTFPAGFQQAR